MACDNSTIAFDAQRFDLSRRTPSILHPRPQKALVDFTSILNMPPQDITSSITLCPAPLDPVCNDGVAPRVVIAAEKLGYALGRACSPVVRLGSPVLRIACPVGKAVGSLGTALQMNPFGTCMDTTREFDDEQSPACLDIHQPSDPAAYARLPSHEPSYGADPPSSIISTTSSSIPSASHSSLSIVLDSATSFTSPMAPSLEHEPANVLPTADASFSSLDRQLMQIRDTDVVDRGDYTVTRTVVRPMRSRCSSRPSSPPSRSASPSPRSQSRGRGVAAMFAPFVLAGAGTESFESQVDRFQDERDLAMSGLGKFEVEIKEHVEIKDENVEKMQDSRAISPKFFLVMENRGQDLMAAKPSSSCN